jgi:dihydropteroate synthase
MQSLFPTQSIINVRGELFEVDRPLIMGILNLTPDSFFDGGKYNLIESQLERVQQIVEQGADIIDIGAQSTRPGATEVGADEEIKRLEDVLKEISTQFPKAIISIDTWHSKVAEFALNNGVDIINDISAGQFDKKIFDVVANFNVPYIIMHTKGKPSEMQSNTNYKNSIIKELLLFFSEKINTLAQKGVNDIIIDPGIGFAKTTEQNFYILNHLKELEFTEKLILVGLSRKSLITKTLKIKPDEALNATTALHMKSLLNGANILRVHDVKEAMETVKLFQKLKENS